MLTSLLILILYALELIPFDINSIIVQRIFFWPNNFEKIETYPLWIFFVVNKSSIYSWKRENNAQNINQQFFRSSDANTLTINQNQNKVSKQ